MSREYQHATFRRQSIVYRQIFEVDGCVRRGGLKILTERNWRSGKDWIDITPASHGDQPVGIAWKWEKLTSP